MVTFPAMCIGQPCFEPMQRPISGLKSCQMQQDECIVAAPGRSDWRIAIKTQSSAESAKSARRSRTIPFFWLAVSKDVIDRSFWQFGIRVERKVDDFVAGRMIPIP